MLKKEEIKKRYEMFKKALKSEVDTWLDEDIHIKNHEVDINFPFIQGYNLHFGEREIIITLKLSECIYNTDKILNLLNAEDSKDVENE